MFKICVWLSISYCNPYFPRKLDFKSVYYLFKRIFHRHIQIFVCTCIFYETSHELYNHSIDNYFWAYFEFTSLPGTKTIIRYVTSRGMLSSQELCPWGLSHPNNDVSFSITAFPPWISNLILKWKVAQTSLNWLVCKCHSIMLSLKEILHDNMTKNIIYILGKYFIPVYI